MDFNKSSWHYRLVSAYSMPSSNLCNYFWQIILYLIISIIFISFLIFLIVSLICAILFVINIFLIDINWIDNKFSESSLYLWFIISLFFFIEVFFMLFNKIKSNKSEKKKNILVELISAKKNKYCPKINWID